MKKEIKEIHERNKKVETDKAWETSKTRIITLAILTYIAVGVYFKLVNIPHPLLNAIVPTFAFMLQQLSLPPFKKIWIKYFYKK